LDLKLDLHYTDPRLVALYDGDNPRGADTDFYMQLASEVNARTILDLGCGTGLLTRELAGNGRIVIGIDPAAAMLAYARQQPGAEQVQWLQGDASDLGTPQADLVLMTGNVAQVFLDDAQWLDTLRAIHAALRPGGYVAFESRNPAARAWESWNREQTYERSDTPFGPLACWLAVTAVARGRVCFEGHNLFEETGETLVVSSELRFRTMAEISDSLGQAGFAVEQVYGDWHKRPFASTSRMMVFVARRE
jgi:SAM-dependent methyltransferase